MKEQSHKSEMRAAIRGDFERLRARREDGTAPVAVASPSAEPVAEHEAIEAVQPVGPVTPEPGVAEAPRSRSSWLDRLRDRH